MRFASGVENRVYAFRLNAVEPELSGPLVLRLYANTADGERARAEGAVQNAVASLGFPAPRVRHVCDDPTWLGAPFLIMERLPGEVMLAPLSRVDAGIFYLLRNARAVLFRMPELIAGLQARLHALDAPYVRDALERAGVEPSLLTTGAHLERVGVRIDELRIDGLRRGYEWLQASRPPEPPRLAICHGDLWFGNVIEQAGTISGVVDWSVDSMLIGDPAYDIAVTSVVLSVGMADVPPSLRWLARRVQGGMANRFLLAYSRRGTVDTDAVRYYQLLRCVDFLSWVAARRVAPELRTKVDRDMLDVAGGTEGFIAFFHKHTGIALEMPPAIEP